MTQQEKTFVRKEAKRVGIEVSFGRKCINVTIDIAGTGPGVRVKLANECSASIEEFGNALIDIREDMLQGDDFDRIIEICKTESPGISDEDAEDFAWDLLQYASITLMRLSYRLFESAYPKFHSVEELMPFIEVIKDTNNDMINECSCCGCNEIMAYHAGFADAYDMILDQLKTIYPDIATDEKLVMGCNEENRSESYGVISFFNNPNGGKKE